ncbi:MAG: hypothetical protein LBE04_00615 [Prevotellaceae bacterium]|nr:hypothetical protein [Prevotellaceae bacterium]
MNFSKEIREKISKVKMVKIQAPATGPIIVAIKNSLSGLTDGTFKHHERRLSNIVKGGFQTPWKEAFKHRERRLSNTVKGGFQTHRVAPSYSKGLSIFSDKYYVETQNFASLQIADMKAMR